MSRQLELDINRPSWAETDFRSEIKDLWSVRTNSSSDFNKDELISDEMKPVIDVNNSHKADTKEL